MLLKCTFRLFCFFPSPLILIAKFEYNNIIFEKRFAPITNYELRITNLFAILCLLPSFILSWALCYAVRYAARRFGLIDAPDESALSEQNHKTHKTPTPLGGGLAIYFAILVTVLTALIAAYYADSIKNILPANLAELLTVHASGIVASAGEPLFLLTMCGILVGLGLWDDAKNLNWRFRLLVEFSVAIATVAAGWRITLFLGDSPAMLALSWIISVFWIVGLINSFNMLDNMDGLSGGVAAICAAFLAGFVLTQPEPGGDVQWFVGGFFLVLTGAACGFLVHNRPPAKLFMGDCGSYTLGYLLATGAISAVYVGQDSPCQAVLAPLFVFAIPLYDMISVIIRRIAHGKSPFVGDANHLSHRLVRMGLSRPARTSSSENSAPAPSRSSTSSRRVCRRRGPTSPSSCSVSSRLHSTAWIRSLPRWKS